ncbi:MAG: SAM-dependent methyltransferase [Candidatus Micrarchaeota archaeon]
MFKPLSQWMEEKNGRYYQSPDTSIHEDFLTYAQSPQGLLTRANALDFHEWASKNEKEGYEVLEVGVGIGAFAQGFLATLKERDEKNGTDVFSRTHYLLADFSKTMLEKAEDSLRKAGFSKSVSFCEYDAGLPVPDPAIGNRKFEQIRCNELFSDLPADMGVNRNGKSVPVYYDQKMAARVQETPGGLGVLEEALLGKMPAGYFIPFNKTAARSIINLHGHLAHGGHMDIFDYGFYRREDFDLPEAIWNDTVVREYGGQWTVDLDFLYLACALAEKGIKNEVEEQKEYAQKWMGGPLELDDAQEKSGLSYVRKENGDRSKMEKDGERYVEDDFFYHMRIEA